MQPNKESVQICIFTYENHRHCKWPNDAFQGREKHEEKLKHNVLLDIKRSEAVINETRTKRTTFRSIWRLKKTQRVPLAQSDIQNNGIE